MRRTASVSPFVGLGFPNVAGFVPMAYSMLAGKDRIGHYLVVRVA